MSVQGPQAVPARLGRPICEGTNEHEADLSSGAWSHPGQLPTAPPGDSPGVLEGWAGTRGGVDSSPLGGGDGGGSSALSRAFAAVSASCGDVPASLAPSSSPSCSRQWEISPVVRELNLRADYCECAIGSDKTTASAAQSEGFARSDGSVGLYLLSQIEKKTDLLRSPGNFFK